MTDRTALDHLWAGWRHSYINAVNDDDSVLAPDATGSLFERILRLDDADGMIVHRGRRCSVLLNAYPYTNGHLLVVPDRAVPDLDSLTDDELTEFARLQRDAVVALRVAYRCDGVNVGINLGRAAGAGVPDHVHAHVLPRWDADSNFMTAVANTRVLPEPLDETWRRVRAAWPAPSDAASPPD